MGILAEHAVPGILRENLPVCVLAGESNQADLVRNWIERAGFAVAAADAPQEALEKIRVGACRAVLADLKMPGMGAFAFLEKALQNDPEVCVILMADVYSADSAIEAIKRGACDYISKPIDFPRLEKTLDELAGDFSQREKTRVLEEKLFEGLQFHGVAGKSPLMIEVFDLIKRVSRHYTNALITGPAGAGKELIARALHDLSPVSHEQFTVCNCSVRDDSLLESQLLGGLFENANGGTLFFDGIGETSLSTQARLFRAIQNRETHRVGSPGGRMVHMRIIAATSRDLHAEVLAGHFREDLFRRLSSVEIRVPALSERPEDIPVLVRYFLKKYAQAGGKKLQGLTRHAQIALLRHNWPGNVRELDTVVAHGATIARTEWIDLCDLPEQFRQPQRRSISSSHDRRPVPLEEVRRIHIHSVLEMCEGNRVRAARMLGIGRTSLYRFLKRSAKQAAGVRIGV